jgi:hypothetical protein
VDCVLTLLCFFKQPDGLCADTVVLLFISCCTVTKQLPGFLYKLYLVVCIFIEY